VKVILQRGARKEFYEAVEFYAEESTRAAERFIEEFEVAAREIGQHPNRYLKADRNHRVVRLDHFPYSIYYRTVGDVIRINAVAHDKRRPGYWRNRS